MYMFGFSFYVCICAFPFFFFYAFHYFRRHRALFTHWSRDPQLLYSKKKFKNWSHSTIYPFQNYFTTVFSIFSKINCIQTDHSLRKDTSYFWNMSPPLTWGWTPQVMWWGGLMWQKHDIPSLGPRLRSKGEIFSSSISFSTINCVTMKVAKNICI